MWFKTKGIIQYDPPRGNLKKKPDWWCVLNFDPEITRYYRRVLEQETGLKLCKPSWGTHASIIRGEKPWPDQMDLWKKYDGQEIEIEYSGLIRQTGDTTGWDRPDSYWFIEVKSEFLINIRKELNLPCNFKLHCTIGRTWNE